MLFSFLCPSCKGKLEADASLSGSQADCPQCGRAVAIPEARIDAGTTLAGFVLERRLGKGGMGEVYLAQQLSVKRPVAVKVLPPSFAANSGAVERFLREGKLAAKLDHANIVTVYGAGEDSGNYYLAMAYVDGESLDRRLKRDPVIHESEALGIVRAVADALGYAWEEFRLLHRDVKPANIMVDRRQRVFLMDLGLAKSVGEDSSMTVTGTILGTPLYMSPEQASGTSDLGVPSDVYSLGATLYHLVTGTPPFTADSALKILHQHVNAPLPPPRDRNPRVTDECSHLLEVMMAKQPAERYGDWRALVADMDRVLLGQAPAAPRPGAGASAVLSGGARPTAPRGPATPAGRTGPTRHTAQPAAMADLARQAQEALARQHDVRKATPAPVPAETPALPTTAGRSRRPLWLGLGLAAAVVVVLAVAGTIVAVRRGRAAPGGPPQPEQVQAERARPTPQTSQASQTGSTAPVPAATTEPAPVTPTPPAVPTAPTAAEPTPTVRRVLDLLAVTDPVRDRVVVPRQGANRWQRQDGALVYLSDGKGGKLAPPVAVRARHYEIEVRYARLSGQGRLHVDLPLGDGRPTIVPVYLDAPGCRFVNGRAGSAWPADKGTSATAVVHFDRNADDSQDHIALRLDGEPLLEWSGAIKDVAQVGDVHPALPGQPVTSLWSHEASYAVRGWTLRVFEGDAEVLPRASPTVLPAPVAPAPAGAATPAGPAAATAAAQAKLAALLDEVAADLLAQRHDEALRHWQAGRDAADLKPLAGQVAAAGKLVEAAARLPQRLLDSLQADVGKTVTVELRSGKGEFEIREVAGTTVRTMVKVDRGKVSRAFALADLSLAEKSRRLGEDDSQESLILRGLAALESGRSEVARSLFAKAAGPLGEALVALVDGKRGKVARPAAPEKPVEPVWEDLLADPKLGAWTCPANTWEVRDGILANEDATKGEIWTRRTYSDYELQLEFKPDKGSNSGVFLNDSTMGMKNAGAGLEIQIQDDATSPYRQPVQLTGAVYSRIAPRSNACRPPGEWNRMVVVWRGRHVTVDLNGARVIDDDVLTTDEVAAVRQKAAATDATLKPGQIPPGRIGLQKLTGVVWFRNVRIR